MSLTTQILTGGDTGARYTISRRDNCLLIEGAVPAGDFAALSKLAPAGAVVSPDLARMARVNFAIGLRADVDALIARLAPGAEAETAQRMAGSGLSEAAVAWLASGERGTSSNTLFTHLTGVNALDRWEGRSHPFDPDDLRRCRLLLERCPELVPELPRMAEVSPQWAMLVEHWNELCSIMDDETPEWRNPNRGDRSPRTYQLMKEVLGR